MTGETAQTAQRWLVATPEYAGITGYTGGIGRHYAALLPALVRQGVAVDLALEPDAGSDIGVDRPSADPGHGVRLVDDGGAARHRRGDHGARRVRRAYLAGGGYDVVFAPEWAGLAASLPRSAPLLTNLATGVRLADEVSGLSPERMPLATRLPRARQAAAERRQLYRSTGLIAISSAMLARTSALYPGLPPARVVRNCIDVEAVATAAVRADTPAAWPEPDGPIVLFVGRSERRKGVEDAFAAFATVHRDLPRARLVLVGAGADARYEPTRAALLEKLPPSARDRVVWLGHVGGDELYGAIARADVALCPSRWEGFGNAALEVKAAGTPLIVTSGSGYDDFCTDGRDCQSVPPADPDRLAAAITVALRHPSWARTLAEHARAQVAEFAPDPVAADLLAAASGLLPSRRVPARV
ncbi:glycosyltransferase family 4 protein [Microbacterium sp. cf332]|uniref:glycosyltransferase family 4 protein n=1 Tax=Microbacterium sp. cf332 TaxID=1761804 RepID=UPI000890F0BE|nr:glycosyltransferase family 4 protein [Microbacterium sp. cf332]SDQ28663.1 (1->4)-alpha-D-glucan synthase (UDP-glucose) [Microbacterium sp. cf332]